MELINNYRKNLRLFLGKKEQLYNKEFSNRFQLKELTHCYFWGKNLKIGPLFIFSTMKINNFFLMRLQISSRDHLLVECSEPARDGVLKC